MKKHQVAILSVAILIFVLASFMVWFFRPKDNIKTTDGITTRTEETLNVKAFFSSTIKDPGTLYCDRTYSVDREVSLIADNAQSRLGELAYLAINELLKGPSDSEKGSGFFTSINMGTKVQRIVIENGIAKVDFNGTLDKYVAGSCRVQAIRSQITETLKQFPEIKEVVISADGRSEDILQP